MSKRITNKSIPTSYILSLSSSGGFTLVELLVVIAIIGILSSFLMANFIGVKQRARDTQRKSDLRQLQSSLELYRSDVGSYPSSLPACGASLTSGTSTYIQKTPCDPLSTQTYNTAKYSYVGTGSPPSTYNLVACLENGNDSDSYTQASDPTGATGTCSSGKYYVVSNP